MIALETNVFMSTREYLSRLGLKPSMVTSSSQYQAETFWFDDVTDAIAAQGELLQMVSDLNLEYIETKLIVSKHPSVSIQVLEPEEIDEEEEFMFGFENEEED